VPEERRKIVLGIGNILNRDEGLGVHCLEDLRSRPEVPPDFEVLDGGVLGLALLPLVEGASHLLLLDAADAGRPAGSLVDLAGNDIPLRSRMKMSWHQVSFQEVLELAKARGNLPEHLHFLGLQPADISTGCGLTPAVTAALPRLVERALEVLEQWREA
jgi:hydrogenase maturation protease